jgi:hypothetical protein
VQPKFRLLFDTVSKLERQAYEQRLKPDHPVHEQAKEATRVYFRSVAEGKAKH